MVRTIGIVMTLVACLTSAATRVQAQDASTQRATYSDSFYANGPMKVTIASPPGGVLSVLDVPAGTAVSIHLAKGEFTPPTDKGADVTFNGDVVIRTRLVSDFRSDVTRGSFEKMMRGPFKLEVHDARVVVSQKQ